MSINSQYIVLFKNLRDQIGPAILARQMYPSHPKKFMIKYIEATKRPYGYLFIDLKQSTPEEEMLNIDIFNDHTTDTSNLNGMIGGGNTEYIYDKAQSVDQFEDKR